MWNQITCNKIIEQKIQSKVRVPQFKNTDRHLKRINNIRGIISINEPVKPTFLVTKAKTFYNKNLRNLQIDRNNQFLVTRIRDIRTSKSTSSLRVKSQCDIAMKNITKHKKRSVSLKKKQLNEQNRKLITKIMNTSSGLTKLWTKKTDLGEEIKKTVKSNKGTFHIERLHSIPNKPKEKENKKLYTEQISAEESFIEEGLLSLQDLSIKKNDEIEEEIEQQTIEKKKKISCTCSQNKIAIN